MLGGGGAGRVCQVAHFGHVVALWRVRGGSNIVDCDYLGRHGDHVKPRTYGTMLGVLPPRSKLAGGVWSPGSFLCPGGLPGRESG
jgi:hypothetical protein